MIHIKSVLRIMSADKRQHIINITGLTIGLSVMLLISLYLKTELSFDKHIANHENKYRLVKKMKEDRVAIFPYIAGAKFQSVLPDLLSLCMVDNEYPQFLVNEQPIKLDNALTSDSSFINMFDLQITEGSSSSLLNEPNTCIISESTAYKLFGKASPIGKKIRHVYNGELTVSAVYKDIPNTTHLKVDLIQSRSTWNSLEWKKRYFNDWGNQGTNIYVALNSNSSIDDIQEKLTQIIFKEAPWFGDRISDEALNNFKISLQAMPDIHLKSSDIQWDSAIVKNNSATLRAFAIVMILVILMASFNYINLSTASSGNKFKTSGLLQSLGAKKGQIFKFFFIQTIITGATAVMLSYIVSWIALPYFQQVLNIKLSFAEMFDPAFLLLTLGIVAVIICLSGIYPAFYFTKSNPASNLKDNLRVHKKEKVFSLRSTLVTTQFVVSIFLMVAISGISKQIKLVTTQELGFNKDQLIEIPFYKNKKQYQTFAQEVKQLSFVESVTAASNMPCEYINNENGIRLVGGDINENISGCIVGVESNYLKTMGNSLIDGRWFKENYKSEKNNVLVNESTVKLLNLTDPIGKIVKLMGKDYSIIGIINDTQYRTLHEPAKPVLYSSDYSNYRKVAIRIIPGNHIQAIEKIKEVWDNLFPGQLMDFNFFDQKIQDNYKTEVSQLNLFNILVAIGVTILLLGLLGLIWFMTENRKKEIGIRKVNGASISEILSMLNKDFIKWGLIAFIIACPLSYLALKYWLQNYAYKTELSWWIFATAGATALGLAVITVTWQSWKAATRNPVEALRYE